MLLGNVIKVITACRDILEPYNLQNSNTNASQNQGAAGWAGINGWVGQKQQPKAHADVKKASMVERLRKFAANMGLCLLA